MTADMLDGLVSRLRGGVHGSVTAARPADFPLLDCEALRKWPPEDAFAALRDIRANPWDSSAGPDAAIGRIVGQLRSRRHLLNTVLFSPVPVLSRLREVLGPAGRGLSGEQESVDAWIAMCWTAEAAWLAVAPEGGAGPATSTGLLRPLAARLRFLVLSEPMRSRGDSGGAWWECDADFGGSGVLDRTFGPESWSRVVGRCQEARREWLGVLDAYQSHPLLSQVRPAELEKELRTAVFDDGLRAPLVLSTRELDQRAAPTAADRAVIADVIERHLLPRFALPVAARLVLYDDRAWRRRGRYALSLVTAAAGLASAGCAASLLLRPAAVVLAAACYLLMCGSVLLPRGGLAPIWLLRMPAAATVGVIALISLMAGGLPTAPPGGGYAVLALGGASFGYLLVEVRNHGVAVAAAIGRALLVWFIGAVHALMVSLIGLVAVAPAFAGHSARLDSLWPHPAYGHAGMVVALAAAWCLAVGVFSQVLWYDQPITAPLAHLSWRSGLPRRRDGVDDIDPAGGHAAVQRRRGPGRQRRAPAAPGGRHPGRLRPRRDALLVPRPGRHPDRIERPAARRAGASGVRRHRRPARERRGGDGFAADPPHSRPTPAVSRCFLPP
jgi:hypothetical protein